MCALSYVHAVTIYYGWRETRALDTTGAPVCEVTHTQPYCQNFRISSKRIRTTDAIVCKAVADTAPQASIQTKLDIPIFLWLTKSASVRFT